MPWRLARFPGYSSLCIARGLAEGGSLLCCDISEAWTAIGVQAWEEAGLRDRIELRIAPAPKTLRRLPHEEDIDLVFIDADKTGYPDYWKELGHRVRPGGVLLIDNVLWSGRVVDPGITDDDTAALRRFNDMVAGDVRVEGVVLTAPDGLTIARKLKHRRPALVGQLFETARDPLALVVLCLPWWVADHLATVSVIEGGLVYGAADGRELPLDALRSEASSSEPKPLVGIRARRRLARRRSGRRCTRG